MMRSITYHSPVGPAFANAQDEFANNLLPFRGMRDFGMELDTEEGLRLVRDSSVRSCGCLSNHAEAGRKSGDLVAMRHPDLSKRRQGAILPAR